MAVSVGEVSVIFKVMVCLGGVGVLGLGLIFWVRRKNRSSLETPFVLSQQVRGPEHLEDFFGGNTEDGYVGEE